MLRFFGEAKMSLGTATNVVYVASYCDQCRLCRFVLRPMSSMSLRTATEETTLSSMSLGSATTETTMSSMSLGTATEETTLSSMSLRTATKEMTPRPQKRHCCFELRPKKRMSLQTATTETHTFNNDEIVADVGFS